MLTVEATQAKVQFLLTLHYLDDKRIAQIAEACEFADAAHGAQKRKSGEPYILHPIAVAQALALQQVDYSSLTAALLHDVVEDTTVSLSEVRAKFGSKVAQLVDGVTKLKSANKQTAKVATLRKILNATLKDPRVIVIKLADRLHNLSTLNAMLPHKRVLIARETLNFYVPMARLVGLDNLANELERYCFVHLEPELMPVIHSQLAQAAANRQLLATQWQQSLLKTCTSFQPHLTLSLIDNTHTIIQDFFKQKTDISSLLSSFSIEILTDSSEMCFAIADTVKATYICNDERDAINTPLAGGKQYLQLLLSDESDSTLQLQIMTRKMHEVAEQSVLIMGDKAPETSRSIIQASLSNLERFLDSDHAKDTVQGIIQHLHRKTIIVYSPTGQPIELPKGATAVDYAYAISNHVGHHAVAAQVNGNPCAIESVLQHGQTVHIVVDELSAPSPEWLSFVNTPKARSYIQKSLGELSPANKIAAGKQALNRSLHTHQLSLTDLNASTWQAILVSQQLSDIDTLYCHIASGNIRPNFVAARLAKAAASIKPAGNPNPNNSSLIADANGIDLHFAKCCDPIYGDSILGHFTKDGISIHRVRCAKALATQKQHPSQITTLLWNPNVADDPRFNVHVRINKVLDALEKTEIISITQDMKGAVSLIDSHKDHTIIVFTVRDRDHLARLFKDIRILLNFPPIERMSAPSG